MKHHRVAVCVMLVAATGAFRHVLAARDEYTVDLSRLPATIGEWRGEEAAPLDESVVRLLAADSYVNRTYSAAGAAPVGVYVAVYAGQKPGDSNHSPLNCLPGTGWEPVAISTVAMQQPDGTAGSARRMIVRKDDQRDL